MYILPDTAINAETNKKQHPHLTPADTWKSLFNPSDDPEHKAMQEEAQGQNSLFTPSHEPGHLEILRLLRENEPNTITIAAIGPLTNLALAAAEDPETFLRCKEVVVMGGNVYEPGNVKPSSLPSKDQKSKAANIPEPPFRLIKQAPGPLRDALTDRNQMTPVAEFNTFADSLSAARVYALTSPNPHTTMPPTPPAPPGKQSTSAPPPYLANYPEKLSRRLKVTLFPLDITSKHSLTRGTFRTATAPLIAASSPLATWTSAWLESTFRKVESLQSVKSGDAVGLELHDPLTVWYCINSSNPAWKLSEEEDVRVETSGQWTRGMCVIDQRSRRKRTDESLAEIPGDHGNWLSGGAGNRLKRCVGTPGEEAFAKTLLRSVFGV
jgi:inosine-uridine nucleoside N-ribohydrolase